MFIETDRNYQTSHKEKREFLYYHEGDYRLIDGRIWGFRILSYDACKFGFIDPDSKTFDPQKYVVSNVDHTYRVLKEKLETADFQRKGIFIPVFRPRTSLVKWIENI